MSWVHVVPPCHRGLLPAAKRTSLPSVLGLRSMSTNKPCLQCAHCPAEESQGWAATELRPGQGPAHLVLAPHPGSFFHSTQLLCLSQTLGASSRALVFPIGISPSGCPLYLCVSARWSWQKLWAVAPLQASGACRKQPDGVTNSGVLNSQPSPASFYLPLTGRGFVTVPEGECSDLAHLHASH